jgi:hypothetical protein
MGSDTKQQLAEAFSRAIEYGYKNVDCGVTQLDWFNLDREEGC